MEIKFKTKSQSNKEQEETFLALTPVERFYAFLNLMQKINAYPTKYTITKKENFHITIKTR